MRGNMKNEWSPATNTAAERTRILVVDDEPMVADFVAELLAAEGYRTEITHRSLDALGLARRNPPDLIVLDMRMPMMDGVELCRHLKADPRTADVPILIVTGMTDVQDMEHALAGGADDFMTKPIQRADLLIRVRSMLRMRQVSEALERLLTRLREMEAARRAAASHRPPHSSWNAVAAHVLVVDPDAGYREALAHLLEKERYRVTTTGSAAEISEDAARDLDAILLDPVTAEAPDRVAMARLQKISPDAPVIIVTANPTVQSTIAAFRGGAFDLIVKGVDETMLLGCLDRAVERRRLALDYSHLIEALPSPSPDASTAAAA